ncbi:TRAF3-interacting protein 1 [Perkinsus chesapeaki]|uniref:TRAF3-interacting protein 1 n=1 Tax=Perkinsus chesapeaki TaxID=330153 RepID=A0A7J6N3P3_PERCH|nr:TRAF3-interacting protein 1 [Perkinsus chesapeaki]
MSSHDATPKWMLATQKSLGTLIKKPRMADKYLAKPPFRFLHDIFTEVHKNFGFGRGLFTKDELDHTKITTKQQKVDFLTKWISCVAYALKLDADAINVNPSKIVTGSEPERTNGFLVRVYEAATKAASRSDAAVEMVKSRGPLVLSSKTGAGLSDEAGKDSLKMKEDADKKKTEEPNRQRADDARKHQAMLEEERRKREEAELADRLRAEAERAKQAEEESRRIAMESERARLQEAQAEQERLEKERKENDKQATQRSERQHDAEQAQKFDTHGAESENEEALRMAAMMAATHERPRTASRRPPQVKSRLPEREVAPESEATALAPPTIIEDGDIEEVDATPDENLRPPTAGYNGRPGRGRSEEHGKLVRDIMEAHTVQTPHEEQSEVVTEADTGIRMGKLRRKKSDVNAEAPVAVTSVAKQYREERPQSSGADRMPFLQDLIQKICGTCTPLGKSMELIQQDVVLMDKDLEAAREDYKEAQAVLLDEKKRTQTIVNPILTEIQRVQDKIDEENDLITRAGVRITKLEDVCRAWELVSLRD